MLCSILLVMKQTLIKCGEEEEIHNRWLGRYWIFGTKKEGISRGEGKEVEILTASPILIIYWLKSE